MFLTNNIFNFQPFSFMSNQYYIDVQYYEVSDCSAILYTLSNFCPLLMLTPTHFTYFYALS
jgi:hypothetical protein